MRLVVKAIALAFAASYLGLAAYIYLAQRSFLYFPDTQRPDATAAGFPSMREITLATTDGLHLLAWYLPPQPNKPVVAYFHGNAGNLRNRVPWLEQFAQAGIGVLMPEYRGYGGNEGTPSEEGFHADANAAMTFFKEQGFGPKQIVVFGESLGTGVATRLAAENPVAALVLEAPYTSITAMAERDFYYLPVSLLLTDRFDSLSRITEVRAPILIIQGERDQVIPPALGRELFAAAPEPKEIWTAPEGGHVNLLQFGAAKAVLDFLSSNVTSVP